jgi:uncharacterized protein (TIGR03435 family)
MLSGGPAWLTKDSFDVDANGPSGSTEYDTMQLRNGEAPQLQEKLRNLLADRFSLKAHLEKRQLPSSPIVVLGKSTSPENQPLPREFLTFCVSNVNWIVGPPWRGS